MSLMPDTVPLPRSDHVRDLLLETTSGATDGAKWEMRDAP